MSELFPKDLVDAISQNTITDDELNHLVAVLFDAGIIEDSTDEDEIVEEAASVQILPDGTASVTALAPAAQAAGAQVNVKRKIFKHKIRVDTRVKWQGIRSRIQTRNVYKTVTLSTNVAASDRNKWIALFLCIAASAALTAALASAVITGGLTASLVVASILAACVACFAAISPETFQQQAVVHIATEKGSWG